MQNSTGAGRLCRCPLAAALVPEIFSFFETWADILLIMIATLNYEASAHFVHCRQDYPVLSAYDEFCRKFQFFKNGETFLFHDTILKKAEEEH
jgi:hypothetical protein